MNVVLVGDSIRLGYQPVVEALLATKASVHATPDNCGSTRDILEHFRDWIVGSLDADSVVHLNAGLHDLRRVAGPAGDVHVPLAEYRRNLEEIVRRVAAQPRVQRLILATSTPVDDARHAAARLANRFSSDVAAYNAVIRTVARDTGAAINDLHGVIAADLSRFIDVDGVHLTSAGNRAAATAVVSAVV